MPTRRPRKPARRRPKTAARRPAAPPLHRLVRLYLGRKSTLLGATTICTALRPRKPRGLGPQVERAFERVMASRVHATAYLGRTPVPKIDLGVRRNALVAVIGRIRRILHVLSRGSSSDQAKQAREARDALLGREGPSLLRRDPAVLWATFDHVWGLHEEEPATISRLEALVTPGLLVELRQAHAALGAAIAARRAPKAPEVDVRAFTAQINGHIDHYALCVLATVTPGDAAALEDALHLLEPILASRTERSRDLRRKRARAAAAADASEPAPPAAPKPKPRARRNRS